MTSCPFCSLPPERIVDESECCLAIRDAFPVSEGHSLIIARRHVGSLFELTEYEVGDVLRLLTRVKQALDAQYCPAGFNVGINDGRAAGQTVPHLHVHLIPRYSGDVSDPRGGVRWIFPEKADYWSRR